MIGPVRKALFEPLVTSLTALPEPQPRQRRLDGRRVGARLAGNAIRCDVLGRRQRRADGRRQRRLRRQVAVARAARAGGSAGARGAARPDRSARGRRSARPRRPAGRWRAARPLRPAGGGAARPRRAAGRARATGALGACGSARPGRPARPGRATRARRSAGADGAAGRCGSTGADGAAGRCGSAGADFASGASARRSAGPGRPARLAAATGPGVSRRRFLRASRRQQKSEASNREHVDERGATERARHQRTSTWARRRGSRRGSNAAGGPDRSRNRPCATPHRGTENSVQVGGPRAPKWLARGADFVIEA